MKIELKTVHHPEKVLKKSLESIEKWFIRLYDQDFDLIKNRYEEHLLFRNQSRKFSAGREVFSGTIKGINETGQLLIADGVSNIRTFNFKEVEYCF